MQIQSNQPFILERFSDSGNAYITLDQNNPSTYKQLYRAAKAKLKLRIRATLVDESGTSTKVALPTREQITEPVKEPRFNTTQDTAEWFIKMRGPQRLPVSAARVKETTPASNQQAPAAFWQIFCNNCDKPMTDAHFHCSLCDGGDFDLVILNLLVLLSPRTNYLLSVNRA